MIDYFALLLGHGLLAVAFLRLVANDALDEELPTAEPQSEGAGDDAQPRRYRSGRRTRR